MNYKFQNKAVTFFVNGNDKTTGIILISIVIGIAVITVAGLFMGIKTFADKSKAKLIAYAAAVLMVSVGLIFLTMLIARKGTFAAYKIVITPETITAYNKRNRQTLFSEKFNPEKLYLADSRMQVGYVSKKQKTLCYGSPVQYYVEDTKPSDKLVVLCSGAENSIVGLKKNILEKLK